MAGSRSRPEVVHARADLRIPLVGLRVLRQGWLLQAITAALVVGAAWWWWRTGDAALLGPALRLEAVAAVGFGLAFAVHEMAHAAVLRRCEGVSHVVVDVTPWRFSLSPRGRMTPLEVVTVAVAGPGAAAAGGVLLWLLVPGAELHWWWWLHLVFLLPVFGDGRSLLVGVAHLLRRPAAG